MKDQPPIYEVHDYSAVEEHIHRQSERKELANKARTNALFTSYLRHGSLGVVALGIFAFLLLFGVSFFKDGKVVIVEKEVLVKGPNRLETAFPEDLKKTIPKAKELTNKLRKQNGNTKDKVDVTTDFVIFRRAESTVKGILTVNTGLNYRDSKQEYPFSQFCYILISKGADQIKVDLGNKSGRSRVNYESYNLLKRHGFSPKKHKKLIDKCKFLN
jgi:hypothetical protein